MSKVVVLFSIFFLSVLANSAKAQSGNSRSKTIILSSDTIKIDTNSIIYNSIEISDSKGEKILSKKYEIDYPKSLFIRIDATLNDTLQIRYKVFPFSFSRPYFNKDYSLVEAKSSSTENPYSLTVSETTGDIFSLGSLSKSGSVSRSVAFGNNQDLSVNSNLSLQLAGKLGGDIDLVASISDDNIPIQAEGNTQQIQDFDRVFIQLKRKETSLIVGDFELRRPDSYFMNYWKKLKGGSLRTGNVFTDSTKMVSGVSIAVAKGKYTRSQFLGTESNQGPYRLSGENNEQFIVILSGTERIILDGEILIRGAENDYIIDYNSAELTFTAKRLITQFSRISAEYEYSDRNYSRSLIQLNNEVVYKKVKVKFNHFAEQDSKNQPLLQTLDNEQKLFLKGIGDQTDLAFFPNIDSVPFSKEEILYKLTDSIGFQFYQYSTNSDSAKYRLGFSQVGTNQGNYKLKTSSTANGRVFEFVFPINTIPQGDYEPILLLITPKKTQLTTLGALYNLNKNFFISSEIAFSRNDKNLFSGKGDKDNGGIGLKISASYRLLLSKNDTAKNVLITRIDHEFINKTFLPLDRYRPPEFERDFNLTGLRTQNESLSGLNLTFLRTQNQQVTYRYNRLVRPGFYIGNLHGLSTQITEKSYYFKGEISNLSTSDTIRNTEFLKQKYYLAKKFKEFTIGAEFWSEQNRIILDTLISPSANFRQLLYFIQNSDSSENTFRIDYAKRNDFLPQSNEFKRSSAADIVNFNSSFSKNPNSVFSVNSTYRKINYQNDTIKTNEETLLSRIQYEIRVLKGFLSSLTYYEIGSGQEPKREFTYLEVPNGQGVYTWSVATDYNKDGIKDLNEFEIAQYSYDANYIRVSVNTTEYVRTNLIGFNEVFTINPNVKWNNKKGIRKFAANFYNQTTFKIDKKVLNNTGLSYFNPFDLKVNDTSLISLNSFVRNTIYFKRADPIYGAEYNYQINSDKILLSGGFETRKNLENSVRLRWNFVTSAGLVLFLRKGFKTYNSEFLKARNFEINLTEITPEFNYQVNTTLRITFSYAYSSKENNQELGGEKLILNRLGSEIRYNLVKRGSISAKLNLINNNYLGESNSSVGYELLEGLQKGNNITWNATLQQNVSKGLQINVTYDGRSSEGSKTIHSGGVQARAFF